MNILVDDFPDAVEIAGEIIPIDTDFRTAIRIILAFEDPELTIAEKQAVLISNLFLEPPPDLGQAIEVGVRFLNGGVDRDSDSDTGNNLRLYSFEKDSALIFAAFKQTHGIDLETAELHWWKFLALFMDLGAETAFCNLVSLRKRVKTGKATKEERRAAKEMGEAFVLEDIDTRTIEEKEREREFLRLVMEAQNAREKENRG